MSPCIVCNHALDASARLRTDRSMIFAASSHLIAKRWGGGGGIEEEQRQRQKGPVALCVRGSSTNCLRPIRIDAAGSDVQRQERCARGLYQSSQRKQTQ